MQPPDLKMTKLHSYLMRFFGVKIRSNFPRLSSESPIVNDSGARLTPATGTTTFLNFATIAKILLHFQNIVTRIVSSSREGL